MFQGLKGETDFTGMISHIKEQKELASNTIKMIDDGNLTEAEAKRFIREIKAAGASISSSVAVFVEMHRGANDGERKTLSDAIEKLGSMSNTKKSIQALI